MIYPQIGSIYVNHHPKGYGEIVVCSSMRLLINGTNSVGFDFEDGGYVTNSPKTQKKYLEAFDKI